jgi:colanic acid/amylovoran biosynthesis glycosyltransferase
VFSRKKSTLLYPGTLFPGGQCALGWAQAPTVAYLANQFPTPVEPYVMDEIEAFRNRGVYIVAGSVRRPQTREERALARSFSAEILFLKPLRIWLLFRAACLCLRRWGRISDIVWRVMFRGGESPLQRAKALLHTWMGAYYALLLADRGVDHIHVHHGYFGSWIAMVAARLLGVGYSMTLHGSDLLLHRSYLDVKLATCTFCRTVSEYNRSYILGHYPAVDADKILVARLGVDVPDFPALAPVLLPRKTPSTRSSRLTLVAVGRLHKVKDHAFLLRACAQLRARGQHFECLIAGEGPERRHLESLIRKYDLEGTVALLGHVPREQMDSLYQRADLLVLTSRSEGIPLVLMEAMACGKLVLAPAITGIPELIVTGKTGFLYQPGSLGDFVARLLLIHSLLRTQGSPGHACCPSTLSAARQLDWVRHGARVFVRHNFNRKKNLQAFGNAFMDRIAPHTGSPHYEDRILQQI